MTWVGVQIGKKADLRIILKINRDDTNARLASTRIGQDVARAFVGNMSIVGWDDATTPARHCITIELASTSDNNVLVAATLVDNNNFVVAALPNVQVAMADTDSIVPLVLYGLDVSRTTLKPLNSKDRPTWSFEAYAKYEAGRHAYVEAKFDRALSLFQQAIRLDPNFAMAYWSVGVLLEKRPYLSAGGLNQKEWKQKATSIDPDHPKWPLDPTREGNPVPALCNLLHKSIPTSVENYSFTDLRSIDYDIRLLFWDLPVAGVDIKVVSRPSNTGTIQDVVDARGAFLAVNGGFYEIDSEQRVEPSGLVIADGMKDPGQRPAIAGSGVLYWNSKDWKIVATSKFSSANLDRNIRYALQSGPRLVEPGGLIGVKSDNGSAVNRTAICLKTNRFGVLVIDGGITLSQLSLLMATSIEDGGLGCDTAINLDGGPSTQAFFYAGAYRIAIGANPPPLVPNFIVIKKKLY